MAGNCQPVFAEEKEGKKLKKGKNEEEERMKKTSGKKRTDRSSGQFQTARFRILSDRC
jgi:hypothetical protein